MTVLDLTKPTLDVGIVAHHVDDMRRFYAGVLELGSVPPIPVRGGEVVVHQVGTSTVKLWCTDAPPPIDEGGLDAAIGYRLLTLALPDVDGVLDRARDAGVTGIERRTFGEGDGAVAVAFLHDSDGNALELVGLPHAEPAIQVGLTVRDLDATTAFTTEALGLPAHPVTMFDDIESHPVSFGSTTLKYWHRGDGLPVHTGPIQDRAGIRYITAQVASVADAVATLQARGVPVVMEPTEAGASTVAFVADPDGNWIELLER